jgi:transcription initiation factor TFIIB
MSGEFASRDSAAKGDTLADVCPECGGDSIHRDDVHGERVCRECGCVLSDNLVETGSSWSAFSHSDAEQTTRVGSPMTELLHDRGLTTKIHWKDTDAHGRPISARKKQTMRRLRTWQTRARLSRSGERNLQVALSEINRMSSALAVPEQVREMASHIYRDALSDDLIQGRSIEAVASSALYIACRNEQIPRSLDEIERAARVDRTEIARTYRRIAAEQELEMKPVDPKLFVPRFCSKLDVSRPVQRRARSILEQAAAEGLHSGKSPTGLAGAAIYLATRECDSEVTQSDIADVAQVTEVTIRNRYQEHKAVVDRTEA